MSRDDCPGTAGPDRHDPAHRDGGFRRAFEADLERRLRTIYGGRRLVVAASVDQGAVRLAAHLRDRLDAEVLAVGARPGTGPIDGTVPLLSLGLPPGGDLMGGMRSAERALGRPPAEIQALVDAWDPGREARVIGEPFLGPATVVGRPVLGHRRPAWVALEDKLAIVEVLRGAGVATGPSVEARVDAPEAVLAGHRRLATELGTVWAGDNRQGWHGGGAGTSWIPDEAAAAEALGDGRLAPFDRIRIMPFVDGVPCSIHGLVVPGALEPAVFRPCEMLTLRDQEANRLVYARSSTHWDPAPADRRAMREVAGRVGRELARRVGYRGAFTVDGILGTGGFVPSEVNLRPGAALPSRIPTASGRSIDLRLVNAALVEGLAGDLDPADLERWLLPILDGNRECRPLVMTEVAPDRARRGAIVAGRDGSPVVVEGGEPEGAPALARFEWGPGASGGLLLFDEVTGLPVGPPSAPVVVEWLRAIGDAWPVGLAHLRAAPAVR